MSSVRKWLTNPRSGMWGTRKTAAIAVQIPLSLSSDKDWMLTQTASTQSNQTYAGVMLRWCGRACRSGTRKNPHGCVGF